MRLHTTPPAAPATPRPAARHPAAAKKKHRVLLVEDHPVVTQGMAELLNFEKDLVVCGTAMDAAAALEQLEALQPELVILDIALKESNGLDLLRQIKTQSPQQRVLMLSMHDEMLYAPRAIRLGAAGYVMKQEATETLLLAIRQVLQGGTYVSPRMEKKLRQRALSIRNGSALDPVEMLTPRESQIFRLIGHGKRTGEIARELCLSPKTVETHRGHMKEKFGLQSATELIRYAVEMEHKGAGWRAP